VAVSGTLVLGGLAALDATPVAQTLASQPLVTSAVLGVLWGDPRTALEVGVVLQVLAACTLPVGARTPEDYATGGVVGAGTALALASNADFESLRAACTLIGAFTGMLAAMGGVPLVKWQRRRNEGLARWCEAELRAGREGALGAAHLAAVVLAFAVALAYTAAGLAAGVGVGQWLVRDHSIRLSHAWMVLQPVWVGFGLAQLLHAFVQRRLARTGAFAAALLTAWLLLVLGGAP
jgi:mannose/fructose/N-acetylgalactosamine-specific phosphotransferase system component IIC